MVDFFSSVAVSDDQVVYSHMLRSENFLFSKLSRSHRAKDQQQQLPLIQKHKSTGQILLMTINACLGAFYYGYAYVVYNVLQQDFHYLYDWSSDEAALYDGLISGLVSIGALLASLLSGQLVHHDRRIQMMFYDLIGIAGIGLMQIQYLPTVLVGRLICGMIAGINTVIVPIYVKEISPDSIYGQMCSYFCVACSTGMLIVVTMAIGLPNSYSPKHYDHLFWRVILGIPVITCTIRFLVLLLIYRSDTPMSLIKKGRNEQAMRVLQGVYKPEFVNEVADQLIAICANQTKVVGFREALSKKYRKRFIATQMVCVFKQFSGIGAVLFYSTAILLPVPPIIPTENQVISSKIFTIIIGVSMFISGIASSVLVDRFGRKAILQYGSLSCCVLLTLMSIFLYFNFSSYIIEVSMVVYMFILGLSLLAVSFIIVPELIPGKGISLAIMTSFGTQAIVGILFPTLQRMLKIQGVFLIFAGWCLFGFVYFLVFLHETKGKSDVQIQIDYEGEEGGNANQYHETLLDEGMESQRPSQETNYQKFAKMKKSTDFKPSDSFEIKEQDELLNQSQSQSSSSLQRKSEVRHHRTISQSSSASHKST